ncbi:MAG: hypothetical protein KC473_11460, partial [Candidatus Dadabacteria bacterium]|nr:hypothetical protein [Candidatus Dadabacteria bacterium]
MNEPHVIALKYSLVKSDSYEFRNPPEIEIETPDFHGYLNDNILKLEPKLHFESEEQIRPIADNFIRRWEIAAGLEFGRPNLRFRFEGSQIIDRKPTPGEKSFHANRNVYFS